jgi:MoxR-like ATPase
MQSAQMEVLESEVAALTPWVTALREEVGKVIVGQRYLVDRLLIGLLAQGHLLLEGVPGLAKTTAVRTLAQALDLSFSRIQFTPDLLPADLLGTQIYNPREASFKTHKGPVFAHLVLADEINRAPAKVQSALLEAMQEGQVTLGDETHALPAPFLVLATQNPIEQEGTYPLPEAQVDRFMMKLRVDYPDRDEEQEILRRSAAPQPSVNAVATLAQVTAAQALCQQLIMEDVVAGYIVDLVRATRAPELVGLTELSRYIEFGASPRASIALAAAARAHAILDLRAYVTPDDVKAVGPDVLRHRILLTYEAEAEDLSSEDMIKKLFERVKTP